MSRVLEFELNSNKDKPVFKTITKGDRKISCLLDTGATIPVWCKSAGLFKFIFPNATLIKGKYILSGFGQGFEYVKNMKKSNEIRGILSGLMRLGK